MFKRNMNFKMVVPLLAFFFCFLYGFSTMEASPQTPKKEEKNNNPAPAWEPFLTYYSNRIRVERRRIDPENKIWEYKIYNYTPGSFGSSFPQEDPLYVTAPVEKAEWILNGNVFPLTKDSNGLVIGTVDFSKINPDVDNTAVLKIFGSGDNLLFESNYGTFQYTL